MTDSELLKRTIENLRAFGAKPPAERFLEMQQSGLINTKGEVQDWNAALAIVASDATDTQQATHFMCRVPALGRPGGAELQVRRESVVRDLKAGKRIMTAYVDSQTGAIREGETVRLTDQGALRIDQNDGLEDQLGPIGVFESQVTA